MQIYTYIFPLLYVAALYSAANPDETTLMKRQPERYIRPLADLATAAVCKQYVQYRDRQGALHSHASATPVMTVEVVYSPQWHTEIRSFYSDHPQHDILHFMLTYKKNFSFLSRAYFLQLMPSRNQVVPLHDYLSAAEHNGFSLSELTGVAPICFKEKIVKQEDASIDMGYILSSWGINCLEGIEELSNFHKITGLNLDDNKLAYAPSFQSLHLPKFLYGLTLNRNFLDRIPDEIFQLTQLESLELAENKLTEIPAGIARLTNLLMLDLTCNNIKEFPETLVSLNNLIELRLSGNFIEVLPSIVASFKSLEDLFIVSNQLKDLPIEDLAQIQSLSAIEAGHNPIERSSRQRILEIATQHNIGVSLPIENTHDEIEVRKHISQVCDNCRKQSIVSQS